MLRGMRKASFGFRGTCHIIISDESEQQYQLHGINHDDDEFDNDPNDHDTRRADLENQQLRGRLPLVDSDEDQELPTAPHSHGLIRRGGGVLH
jgi:hypothetical protein